MNEVWITLTLSVRGEALPNTLVDTFTETLDGLSLNNIVVGNVDIEDWDVQS